MKSHSVVPSKEPIKSRAEEFSEKVEKIKNILATNKDISSDEKELLELSLDTLTSFLKSKEN